MSEWRFMGLDLEAAPGVFVVREETEILGNAAVRALADRTGEVRVLDMGCGSGNLSCAIATQVPNARIWASTPAVCLPTSSMAC